MPILYFFVSIALCQFKAKFIKPVWKVLPFVDEYMVVVFKALSAIDQFLTCEAKWLDSLGAASLAELYERGILPDLLQASA